MKKYRFFIVEVNELRYQGLYLKNYGIVEDIEQRWQPNLHVLVQLIENKLINDMLGHLFLMKSVDSKHFHTPRSNLLYY